MSIFDSNVQFESRPTLGHSRGLPDCPALEMQLAAEMREEFPEVELTPADEAVMYRDFQVRQLAATYTRRVVYGKRMRCWFAWVFKPKNLSVAHEAGDHRTEREALAAADALALKLAGKAFDRSAGAATDAPRPTPPAGAMFPEVVTWSDDQLIVAIDLCERREPSLKLHAVGDVPDRHEALLDECSAELVRRLEARGANLAA